MSVVLAVMHELIAVLKLAFLAAAAVLLVVFTVDWLVRTRRISPFSSLARFFRKTVQPALTPIENRVVRAGGLPSAAPWWALVAAVVGGIIIIVALEFVRGQLQLLASALPLGARGLYLVLVSWTFGILQIALLVRVLSSWFRLSEFSRWIRWAVVLTEPILRPLRGIIPMLGMIDVTPLVAWFLLALLSGFLRGLAVSG